MKNIADDRARLEQTLQEAEEAVPPEAVHDPEIVKAFVAAADALTRNNAQLIKMIELTAEDAPQERDVFDDIGDAFSGKQPRA